jgi:hypothetical protein
LDAFDAKRNSAFVRIGAEDRNRFLGRFKALLRNVERERDNDPLL